jgi:hypothetical protein
MLSRTSFVVIAVVSAVVGAHSLNPRELYNQMYPVETLKRDAFHICDESDPTFVRAVGADREACYNSMPHLIAVALGRARPGSGLTMAALQDPSREAELLMTLAAMPPRQPITVPRSFANTAWLHALAPACDDKQAVASVAYTLPSSLPPPPGKGRAAALDSVILGNLPPVPRAAHGGIARRDAVPVLPLAAGSPAPPMPLRTGDPGAVAAFDPLPSPDIGDLSAPTIVPLAPASNCSGA